MANVSCRVTPARESEEKRRGSTLSSFAQRKNDLSRSEGRPSETLRGDHFSWGGRRRKHKKALFRLRPRDKRVLLSKTAAVFSPLPSAHGWPCLDVYVSRDAEA